MAADSQQTDHPAKRLRISELSWTDPVPVYSNQVSSSLNLNPPAFHFTKDDAPDDDLLDQFSWKTPSVMVLSDDDDKEEKLAVLAEEEVGAGRSPSPPSSPPPSQSPVQKLSRKTQQKLRALDRNLQAIHSLMSPERPNRKSRRCQDGGQEVQEDSDDVIIVSPTVSPYSCLSHQIPLKVRCRTEVHKVPVHLSTCLSAVVTQLSVILGVPPTRLLLLRGEEELQTDWTIAELGLGIADIIECAVMATSAETKDASAGDDIITVKLQSKDRHACQEFSVQRDAPLGAIFSRYVSQLPRGSRKNVLFHFDGCKVSASQTAAQLDMEDGDIIEVWT